ncbi:MAG TPA: PIN domain-containing protein [Caldilineaceae bacterium]|nr:PIN domain-containing protein [Caldilineaceae bacterium]
MNPRRDLFVDTSFFVALANSADADHQRALALHAQVRDQSIQKITSEYVLIELGDGLSRLSFRPLAHQILALVRMDRSFAVVPASTSLFEAALHLFHHRRDKEWGLTDCTSFVIMQQLSLVAALTADHHFEQAGFQALLRTDSA